MPGRRVWVSVSRSPRILLPQCYSATGVDLSRSSCGLSLGLLCGHGGWDDGTGIHSTSG